MNTTEQNIQIGDRVLCKLLGVLATVDHFGIQKGKKTYIVKYDEQRVRADGFKYQFDEYSRYGITKNYDQNGKQIIGNAQYYSEELRASYWGDEQVPRKFWDLDIYPPTAKRSTWLIDSLFGVEETSLDDICNRLATLYQQKNSEMQTETVEA